LADLNDFHVITIRAEAHYRDVEPFLQPIDLPRYSCVVFKIAKHKNQYIPHDREANNFDLIFSSGLAGIATWIYSKGWYFYALALMIRISKNFLKSSFIYTVAGSLPVVSAIVLLPFYSANLTTSDFGALSIYLAFTLLIQYITTYSFDISLYIHFHEFRNEPKKLASFVSSAFILMLMIGGVVAAVLTISGDILFKTIFSDRSIRFYPYGLLASATGIFQALLKVHSNLVQSRERPDVFFWSNVTSFLFIMAFTIAGLYMFPHSLAGPVGGRFIAAIIMGVWALQRIFREFGIHFNYPLLRSSFSFNLYTFIYQLLQWVINYFDRILLLFYISLSSIGVYDFGLKCLLIIEFLLNGLHNSFYPRIVSTIINQKEKQSTPEINRYYHGFTSVIMVLICLCILTFPWAIETFVPRKDYHRVVEFVPYLAVLYIFRAIRLYFAVPYGILKHSKPLPGIYIVVSAIKILVIILLVKQYEIYGIVIASVVSAILEIILLKVTIRNRFEFRFNFYKIVGAPVLLFLLIVILEPLYGAEHPYLLHTFYLLACLAMLWWVYRNDIKLIDPRTIIKN
jgi:O-antigen/teichoic acid export membrane protein